jgi:hypothetical protein
MMLLFAKSEQYNRRVTALASYRLDKQKMLEDKPADTKLTPDQSADLYLRVDQAVDYSQGNYDKFNYPSFAQGPMLRYLYLYKHFQVITIEHMWSLSRPERLTFLAFLALTAGLKGIPFAGNFADLIDTLMELFGIKWSGLEHEISKISTAAGLPSGLLFRGVVNEYLGISWSARAGFENPIPGTGAFKAGAEPMRVVKDIVGPAYSAWEGFFSSASLIGKYGLSVLGARPDAVTLGDIARSGLGVTALKNVAKGVTYMADGYATDTRGRLVAKDIGVMSAIAQMFGFAPSAVARQYDVSRMMNYARDLSNQYSTEVITAYIKADAAGRTRIRRSVRRVNRDVGRDSPFYISNFGKRVQRTLKSFKLTSTERNLKALPKNLRPMGKALLKAHGLSPKGIELTR